jgi:GTP pyrophosphokinase
MYEADRRIVVEWAKDKRSGTYPVKLTVFANDRAGMLKQVTAIISDDNTNIRNIEASSQDRHASIGVVIDVEDVKHLERIVAGLRKVPGVRDVQRVLKL